MELRIRLRDIVEQVETMLDDHLQRTAPQPPTLPSTPASSAPTVDLPTPPPRLPLVLAASIIGIGLSALAAPEDFAVSIESGRMALKHGNYVKAEAMFHRADDELGVAEAFIDQRRYPEAELICERYPQDGKAKLFSALIRRAQGDTAACHILLCEARDLGNKEARDLLAMEAKRS